MDNSRTRLYGAFEENDQSKIFRNEQFGNQGITVERPLRLRYTADAEAREPLGESAGGVLARLEHHAYLLALAGPALFYGVERATVDSRDRRREREGRDASAAPAFWLSIGSFAFCTGLIGATLEEEADAGRRTLVLFAFAMALYVLVNDYGLREHHELAYRQVGRWLLAGAVAAGWMRSQLMEVPETAFVAVLAFLAGGVVLNFLKEELPERRRSRFSAFVVGAAGYALLLQVV